MDLGLGVLEETKGDGESESDEDEGVVRRGRGRRRMLWGSSWGRKRIRPRGLRRLVEVEGEWD